MDNQESKEMAKKTITVDIANDMEKGVYSNQMIIGHSKKEFILDFGLLVPPGNKIKIVSRVITNPFDAKVMATVLNENIARYEKMFGIIQVPQIKTDTSDHHLH